MARDLPTGHASADAGMVKIRTLAVGDRFMFYPRTDRYEVVAVEPTVYREVGDENLGVMASGNWWVWPLDKDGF